MCKSEEVVGEQLYKCCKCGNDFPKDEVVATKYYKGKVSAYRCKGCKADNNLKHRHGITLEEKKAMEKAQDYRCGSCRKHKDENARKRLVVDHCHRTGMVRELLCDDCNTALGLLYEDIENAKHLIDYMERHNITSTWDYKQELREDER